MNEFINQSARKRIRTFCANSKRVNKVTGINDINAWIKMFTILAVVGVIADIILFSFASNIRNSAYYYWRSDFQSFYSLFTVFAWLDVLAVLMDVYHLLVFRRAKSIVKVCPNCGCVYLPEDPVCSFCGADVRAFNVNGMAYQDQAAKAQPKGGRMCPKCRTVNQEDSRFCQACGFDFSTVKTVSDRKKCPVCGSEMPTDSLFCPNCGRQQEME